MTKRQELETRLTKTQGKIEALEAELAGLREKKRTGTLERSFDETREINRSIRDAKEELEHQAEVRDELAAKIKEFAEKLEPEAAKIRRRLGEELWPEAYREYQKLKATIDRARPIMKRLLELNEQMRTLARKHNEITGKADGIWIPGISFIQDWAMLLSGWKLVDREPPETWDMRLTSQRTQKGTESQQKRGVVEPRPMMCIDDRGLLHGVAAPAAGSDQEG